MGETYESVTVETKDQVAQVTLIGPGKGNAMGPAFWSEMPEVFHALDADREVRAIVITGSGKNFSYGLDVPAMGGMFAPLIADGALARPRTDFHTEILRMQKAINAVADCRTPTIAAVQGWCIGGAVDLISAVDIRYASADAKFSVREVKLAIVADMGSLARLPLILSDGHLRELALTGKNIDAARAEKIPVTTDTPFCVYSAAKAITATVVHMLVERGHFALDDRVCEYLPSYTSHGKHRTTIRHVLTHSAGVPFPTGPRPDVRRADDHEYAVERLGELRPLYRPGLVHIYHALTWGPLMREIVYAATGKEIREILATEILDPLGFRWTNFGVAERDVPLVAPSHATGRQLPPVIAAVFRKAIGGTVHEIIPYTNTPFFLSTILPSSNTVSTANELSRFMEILRRGGELDGVRVLSPETLRGAVTECRRLRPDFATGLMPLRWGTGFMLGSAKYGPFGRNAPAAFGHLGLVNIAVWADPERALSGGLISSGKPGRDPEAGRYGALLNAITAEIPRASSG
ncbi:crotonase/enoyl-CoA hydratase family protein [Mycobacterium tuberculosis]